MRVLKSILIASILFFALYSFSQISVQGSRTNTSTVIENAPDDTTLENIPGQSYLRVVHGGIDTLQLDDKVLTQMFQSSISGGKYPVRISAMFSSLENTINNGGSSPVSGKIICEPGYTETIYNKTLKLESNTWIQMPTDYYIDYTNNTTHSEGDTASLFRVWGKQNLIFDGGFYDGNAMNADSQNQHIHAIELWNCEDVYIINATFWRWPGDGIFLCNCRNVYIMNCTFYVPNVSGDGDPNGLIGRQALSVVNTSSDDDNYIDAPTHNIQFIHNTVYGGGYDAVDIEPLGAGRETKGIRIAYNDFRAIEDSTRNGVTIAQYSRIEDVSIDHNKIIGYTFGIEVGVSGADSILRNVVVHDNVVDSCEYGFFSARGNKVDVYSNTFSNCTENGAFISVYCTNYSFHNNDFYHNDKQGFYSYGYNGINSILDFSYNKVFDNSQDSTGKYVGASFLGTDTLIMSNNLFFNSFSDDSSTYYQSYPVQIINSEGVNVYNNWSFSNRLSNDMVLSGLVDSLTSFRNNLAGFETQSIGTGSGVDTKMFLVIANVVDGDSNSVFYADSLIEGEVSSNAISSGESDWGLLALSAGGGTTIAHKMWQTFTGYTDGFASTKIRFGSGHDNEIAYMRSDSVVINKVTELQSGVIIGSGDKLSKSFLSQTGDTLFTIVSADTFLSVNLHAGE